MKLFERSPRPPQPPKSIEVVGGEPAEESELETLINSVRRRHQDVIDEYIHLADFGNYFVPIGDRLELFPEDEGCWDHPDVQKGWAVAKKEITSALASPRGDRVDPNIDCMAINLLRLFPIHELELQILFQAYISRRARQLGRPIDHLLAKNKVVGDELTGLTILSIYDDRGPDFWRAQGRQFIQPFLQKIREEDDTLTQLRWAKELLLLYPECRTEMVELFPSVPLEIKAKLQEPGGLLDGLEMLAALRVIYADEAYLTPEAKLVVKNKSRPNLSSQPLPDRPI